MRIDNGRFLRCPECEAPWTEPIPDDWTVTAVGNYGLGHLVTPHKPGCPAGFKPVVVEHD